MATAIDRLHSEFEAVVARLVDEPSLRSSVDDNFRKSLLLASASYFEFSLSKTVEDFALLASGSSTLVAGIIKRKAISRQYHTWFDWNANNANQFYGLFGKDFASYMKNKHATEDWLDSAVSSFMELGRARNLLVHENYAVYALEKTTDEIYASYQQATRFVEKVSTFLNDCNQGVVGRATSADPR